MMMMLKSTMAMVAGAVLFVSAATGGGRVAEEATISKLSAGVGAMTGEFSRKARRCVDQFTFTSVSAEFTGLPYVAVRRGDKKKPGAAFAFDVDREVVVYLLVHNLQGRSYTPPGWTLTVLVSAWKGTARHSDTVCMKRFAKGTVSIPPHPRRKPNGTHGIPHLAVVATRPLEVEPVPSPLESMTAIGKVAARPSLAIAASPLSVGFETLDRRMFHPERTYAHLAKLGVKWARVQTGWARTETTKGKFDFAWLDAVVDNLRKVGVQPWFSLSYGNRLYSPKAPDASAVAWVPMFDEAARQGWTRYTRAIARHFRGRVRHYEIWNEVNIGFWGPKKPNPKDYVDFLKLTVPMLRAEVPDVVIIGGAFAGMPLTFLKQCLDAGMADHVDRVSYHPYRPMPESGGYARQLAGFRTALRAHKPTIRLWQGENGTPSQRGGVGAMGSLPWTEARQAKWLTRRILTDLHHGVELTSYFHTVDLVNYNWGKGGSGRTNYKGLLRGTDYTPKPSYFAYQCLCALFDAETTRAALKADLAPVADDHEPIKPTGIVWAPFVRGGRALCAYWRPVSLLRNHHPRRLRLTLHTVAAATLTNPVLVDPLSGNIYPVEATRGKDGVWVFESLPLLDYALLLTDRSVAEAKRR